MVYLFLNFKFYMKKIIIGLILFFWFYSSSYAIWLWLSPIVWTNYSIDYTVWRVDLLENWVYSQGFVSTSFNWDNIQVIWIQSIAPLKVNASFIFTNNKVISFRTGIAYVTTSTETNFYLNPAWPWEFFPRDWISYTQYYNSDSVTFTNSPTGTATDFSSTEYFVYWQNIDGFELPDPNLVEYCYTKPIKESVFDINSDVVRNVDNSSVYYDFSHTGTLDFRLKLDDWLDDFSTWSIITDLSTRGFDTVLLTLDRDISIELPVINWTYEIFLWNQTNITGVSTDTLWAVYNTDFNSTEFFFNPLEYFNQPPNWYWKIIVPGNIWSFKLDWTFLISPYSMHLFIFSNTDNWQEYCFSTNDFWTKVQLDELINQESSWIISTDDMIYSFEQIISDNDLVVSDWDIVAFESNNVVPNIAGVWLFDFLTNPTRDILWGSTFSFIVNLLVLWDLPESIDWWVTFLLPKLVFNDNWTFDMTSYEVYLEFITDKMWISNIERNVWVSNFISFIMAVLYISWKILFVFLLLTPIFLLLKVFTKFSTLFDLTRNASWNILSIPSYLAYLVALFLTIWVFVVFLWSFYDFLTLVISFINIAFVWTAWSLWDYDFFRNVVAGFYVWFISTLTTFLVYRLLAKFGKLN